MAMRLLYMVMVLAIIAGGIGLSLHARGGQSSTNAFLQTAYAAVSGNVEGLFGSVTGIMGGTGYGAPKAPKARVQSVPEKSGFASTVEMISGWFGSEEKAKPRVRAVPNSGRNAGVSMVQVGR